MLSCPNKSLKEWKDLVKVQGKKSHYLWSKYDGNVPDTFYQKQNITSTQSQSTDKSEEIKWIKSVMPNANVELVNELIDGVGKGSYNTVEDLITLSERYADKKTAKHEVFHRAFNLLPKAKQEKILNEGSKLFGIKRGESKSTVKYSKEQQNQINYTLKAVDILKSDKAEQVFAKGEKNKWDLNKILTELQVPKEQKKIILDGNYSTYIDELDLRENIIVSLIADNSFAIEINTTEGPVNKLPSSMGFEGLDYEFIEDGWIDEIEPTQYYSNLSAPGSTKDKNKYEDDPDWEYQEIEIATPLITPSIKGHAEFSTANGIGWFRVWYNKKTGAVEVQEVQSDLFQKGRDRKDLAGKVITHPAEFLAEENQLEPEWEELLPGKVEENQFLQLLNKKGTWVNVFIQSIVQDSVKKGYEKLLFPSGNTASKIEGHNSLEEFKKEKEDRIKELEIRKSKNIDKVNQYDIYVEGELVFENLSETEISEYQYSNAKILTKNTNIDAEIAQLKEELKKVETEGFGALAPIYDFYENRVTNTLNKMFDVKVITDEHGNTWNEIDLSSPKVKEQTENIKFQSPNIEYTGDLAIEEKIAEMMEETPDEKLPKTVLGKWIQSVRNFFRDLFKERSNIQRLLRNINQGRIQGELTSKRGKTYYQLSSDRKNITIDDSLLQLINSKLAEQSQVKPIVEFKQELREKYDGQVSGFKVRLNVNEKLKGKEYENALEKISQFLYNYNKSNISQINKDPRNKGKYTYESAHDKNGNELFKILSGGNQYLEDSTFYVGNVKEAEDFAKAVSADKELINVLSPVKPHQYKVGPYVGGRFDIGKQYKVASLAFSQDQKLLKVLYEQNNPIDGIAKSKTGKYQIISTEDGYSLVDVNEKFLYKNDLESVTDVELIEEWIPELITGKIQSQVTNQPTTETQENNEPTNVQSTTPNQEDVGELDIATLLTNGLVNTNGLTRIDNVKGAEVFTKQVFNEVDSQKVFGFIEKLYDSEYDTKHKASDKFGRGRRSMYFSDRPYKYSGTTRPANLPTGALKRLIDKVTAEVGFEEGYFDMVLINEYKDGSQKIGFHTDNEPILNNKGKLNPSVVTISFGDERTMILQGGGKEHKIPMTSGLALIMGKDGQINYKHGISPENNKSKRFSITLRHNAEKSGNINKGSLSIQTNKFEKSKPAGLKVLKEFSDRLISLNPDITVEFVTTEELANMGIYNSKITRGLAESDSNTIYINTDIAATSDVMHEFGHLLMQGLEKVDSDLYNSLIQAALEHPEAKAIAESYPKLSEKRLGEEVFVTLLGEMGKNKYETAKETSWWSKFKGLVRDVLDKIFEVFRRSTKSKDSILDYTPEQILNTPLQDIIDVFGDSVMKGYLKPMQKKPITETEQIIEKLKTLRDCI